MSGYLYHFVPLCLCPSVPTHSNHFFSQALQPDCFDKAGFVVRLFDAGDLYSFFAGRGVHKLVIAYIDAHVSYRRASGIKEYQVTFYEVIPGYLNASFGLFS